MFASASVGIVANLNLIAADNVDQLWTHDHLHLHLQLVMLGQREWSPTCEKKRSKHEHDASGP